ncbi:endocuticle structural glycoprotein SgAbd-5 [Drosophila busckii]|uniref:endocuticle structural glycoprotein SgAbd-5 n=1 Tax=Drosophila busckii TaxID=30019 RepID=UPI001432CA67|nr:endocuticle structural glycoprotein SgAbd-5 [Drosophila busckii]
MNCNSSLIFVLLLMLCSSLAQPRPDDQQAETLRLDVDNNGVDKYAFSYETSNGITRSEEGELKPGEGDAEGVISVHGSTSWTAPDGKKYEVSFTADETGYHPTVKLVPRSCPMLNKLYIGFYNKQMQ